MTDRREIGNFQIRDIFLFMVHVILFEKDFYDNEESRVTLDSLPQKIYMYICMYISRSGMCIERYKKDIKK